MAPFQLGCVGVGSENAFSNRSLFALMGTPKIHTPNRPVLLQGRPSPAAGSFASPDGCMATVHTKLALGDQRKNPNRNHQDNVPCLLDLSGNGVKTGSGAAKHGPTLALRHFADQAQMEAAEFAKPSGRAIRGTLLPDCELRQTAGP